MRPRQFTLAILLCVCICLAASIYSSTSVLAQTVELSWAIPERVPGFKDSGLDPIILADPEGNIHLFNSQPVGDNLSIFYIRWTPKEGWSTLVDVITSPQGGARVYGAHLDQQGWIHLIFFGGDDFSASIFYTKAPAQSAGKSTTWSEPVLIGESAITPSMAAMVGDRTGFMMVLYSGNSNGNGLYTVHSADGGKSWEAPKPIFYTYSETLWPTALKLYMDVENNIYAAWAVTNDLGLGEAIYFARYSQSEQGWTRPTRIAKAIGYEADTPTIIKYQNEIILIHHNDQPTTHWMYRSSDDGETWTQPIRLFEQVGGNGPVSMVIDSSEILHMLFGNRVDSTGIHAVWHSRWMNDHWSNPEAIVAGPQIRIGPNGEEGFDPSFIQAVISRGNLLFTIWRHDPMAGPTNIWFSYRTLDATELPPTPFQVITAPTSESPVGVTTADPTATIELSMPTPVVVPPSTPAPVIVERNPSTSIFLGIFAVGLLLLVTIMIQKRLK